MIRLQDFLILTKFKLSLTVTLSCLFSFILVSKGINSTIILPLFAVLCLALGVSALNQVQEHQEDSKMQRTKNRPVASKRISTKIGFILALILIAFSMLMIYQTLLIKGVLIFLFVIFLYNILYTKGKKITIYASVYGAILGTIPPLIGWTIGGGKLLDIQFIAIALFYFVWQIPHFWLLMLKHYKEYEKAGFPIIVNTFGIAPLERITFIWLLLTLITGLFTLAVFELNRTIFYLLILFNFYTLYGIIMFRLHLDYIKIFIQINVYITVVMLLLCLNVFL
jgi:protoheme IX farnesyltransferase